MKVGQRVKIVNLDYINIEVVFDAGYEEPRELIDTVAIYTGKYTDMDFYDYDEEHIETAYKFELANGEYIYLFDHNYDVIRKKKEIKSEVEWLDQVKENFKY